MDNPYQEGYNQGYQDAMDGLDDGCSGFLYRLMDILNTESQDQWEEGYRNGHAAGYQERKENE